MSMVRWGERADRPLRVRSTRAASPLTRTRASALAIRMVEVDKAAWLQLFGEPAELRAPKPDARAAIDRESFSHCREPTGC